MASIAVQSPCTERSSTVWRELSRLCAVCKEEDRGAFGLAFTFLLALHGDRYKLHLRLSYAAYYAYADLRRCALVTLMVHLSLGPYKESVKRVHIQMQFHAVGRSFRPLALHIEKMNADISTAMLQPSSEHSLYSRP